MRDGPTKLSSTAYARQTFSALADNQEHLPDSRHHPGCVQPCKILCPDSALVLAHLACLVRDVHYQVACAAHCLLPCLHHPFQLIRPACQLQLPTSKCLSEDVLQRQLIVSSSGSIHQSATSGCLVCCCNLCHHLMSGIRTLSAHSLLHNLYHSMLST